MISLATPSLRRSASAASSGVAFQFVLDTLLETSKNMQSMQQLLSRHFGYPLAALAFSPKSKLVLKILHDHVENLVTIIPHEFSVVHETGRGLLHRLRQDCHHLANDHQPAAILEELADKMWLEGNLALFALKHGDSKAEEEPKVAKRLPFLGHIARMIKLTERFIKAWPRLLKSFRLDENVLFFLLRRRKDIDETHALNYVQELISKLYPSSRDQFQAYLSQCYKERGFNEQIPVIHSLIGELKKW